jgi:hypothetical protein
MTNYAQFVAKKVPLASEFGEKFARRIFGDDDIDDLPVYVAKRKAGSFGFAEKGGWVREGNYYDGRLGM